MIDGHESDRIPSLIRPRSIPAGRQRVMPTVREPKNDFDTVCKAESKSLGLLSPVA